MLTGDADAQVGGCELVMYDMTGSRMTATTVRVVRLEDVLQLGRGGLLANIDVDSDSDDGWETDELSEGEEQTMNTAVSAPQDAVKRKRTLPHDPTLEHLVANGFSHPYKLAVLLSGCDYLPSIKNVGLATAIKVLKAAVAASGGDAENVRGMALHTALVAYVAGQDPGRQRNVQVPAWCTPQALDEAIDCFDHQVVFDPESQARVCMRDGCDAQHGPHRGTIGVDVAQHSDGATSAAVAVDIANGKLNSNQTFSRRLPQASMLPNYGYDAGEPKYVAIGTTAVRAALPPKGSTACTADETAAVTEVLLAYNEGHSQAPQAPAERMARAHALLDNRDACVHADVLAGVPLHDTRTLPDLSTFTASAVLKNPDAHGKAELQAFCGLFQGLKVSTWNKGPLVEIVKDIRELLKQKSCVPRLKMSAVSMMKGTAKRPDPLMFTTMLPHDMQHLAPKTTDGEWLTDPVRIGLVAPSITLAVIEHHYVDRLAADGQAHAARHTMMRANRLISETTIMPQFRAQVLPREGASQIQKTWLMFRSLAFLRGAYKLEGNTVTANESVKGNYWAAVLLESNRGDRKVSAILACVCECVAGEGDCSHCCSLVLAWLSAKLHETDASGQVVRFHHTSHTQYEKTWSGAGDADVGDLSIPIRLQQRAASVLGKDSVGADLAPQLADVHPEHLVAGAALKHVIDRAGDFAGGGDGPPNLDHLGPKMRAYVLAERKNGIRAYNSDHAHPTATRRRRRTGRNSLYQDHKSSMLPGQLGVDEWVGPADSALGEMYVVHAQDWVRLFELEEFAGTAAHYQATISLEKHGGTTWATAALRKSYNVARRRLARASEAVDVPALPTPLAADGDAL